MPWARANTWHFLLSLGLGAGQWGPPSGRHAVLEVLGCRRRELQEGGELTAGSRRTNTGRFFCREPVEPRDLQEAVLE